MGRVGNSKLLSHKAAGVYAGGERSPLHGSEAFIRVREKLLDWITGSRSGEVLNPGGLPDKTQSCRQLAGELQRALKAIRAQAAWDQGRRVDYAVLKRSAAYAAYRQSCRPALRTFYPGRLATLHERLAFWINLFNALALDGLVSLGIEPRDGRGFFKALAFSRRASYQVGGQWVSLNDIQHGILRGNKGHPGLPGPQFSARDPRQDWVVSSGANGVPDPRLHMALNPCRRSSAPVRVYDPQYLEAQLERAARGYVDRWVRFDPVQGSIALPPVFRWYAGDFGGRQGVMDFLKAHLPDDERLDWIETYGQELLLDFDRDDWSLNV
jgi:hypothetical protein